MILKVLRHNYVKIALTGKKSPFWRPKVLFGPLQWRRPFSVFSRLLNNHIGGQSLPMKSEIRLTDHPHITIAVYDGPKHQNVLTLVFKIGK